MPLASISRLRPTRTALPASLRVASETRTCPPVVKDWMREARLTWLPTTPYFMRSGEPTLPTTTGPVWMPMPISISGRPSWRTYH